MRKLPIKNKYCSVKVFAYLLCDEISGDYQIEIPDGVAHQAIYPCPLRSGYLPPIFLRESGINYTLRIGTPQSY